VDDYGTMRENALGVRIFLQYTIVITYTLQRYIRMSLVVITGTANFPRWWMDTETRLASVRITPIQYNTIQYNTIQYNTIYLS